jgi:hypothetical protein
MWLSSRNCADALEDYVSRHGGIGLEALIPPRLLESDEALLDADLVRPSAPPAAVAVGVTKQPGTKKEDDEDGEIEDFGQLAKKVWSMWRK